MTYLHFAAHVVSSIRSCLCLCRAVRIGLYKERGPRERDGEMQAFVGLAGEKATTEGFEINVVIVVLEQLTPMTKPIWMFQPGTLSIV